MGPDGGISASKYCYIGGFDATRAYLSLSDIMKKYPHLLVVGTGFAFGFLVMVTINDIFVNALILVRQALFICLHFHNPRLLTKLNLNLRLGGNKQKGSRASSFHFFYTKYYCSFHFFTLNYKRICPI